MVVYSYGSTPGLPSQVQVISENGQIAKSLGFTYDGNGNLSKLVDGDGRVIMQNGYDGQGRVVTQQDGRGATSQFKLNNVTTQTWGANSLLNSKTFPGGGTETYTYLHGLLSSKTDANGNGWNLGYDAAADSSQARIQAAR